MSKHAAEQLARHIDEIHTLLRPDGTWIGGVALGERMVELRKAVAAAQREAISQVALYKGLDYLIEAERQAAHAYYDAKHHKASALALDAHQEARRAVSAYREEHRL